MKLIPSLLVLFLATCAASAQLSVDKNTFDLELHPGEVQIKTIVLENLGTETIYDITTTPVGGNAKDLIYVQVSQIKRLEPVETEKDKEKTVIPVICMVPPETEPGSYKGYMYIMNEAPPSMPIPIEFNINVIKQESYGLNLLINDAKSDLIFAKPDEPADMEISISNLGSFKDVVSINATHLPEGWTVTLIDGDSPVDMPYQIPVAEGSSHNLHARVSSPNPGTTGEVDITATSLGNTSKNSTVKGVIEFGVAIRGYDVKIDVPEKMIVNRTYNGAFSIALAVNERINISMAMSPELMALPSSQTVITSPGKIGIANFTILATQPGQYGIVFGLSDSNGVPMPPEVASVTAVRPEGTAILTGDLFVYKTLASLYQLGNQSIPVMVAPISGLSESAREELMAFSKVIILGGESVVSLNTEKSLANVEEVTRVDGEDISETSWRLVSEVMQNGTTEVVISGTNDVDVFKGYEEAKNLSLPLVISGPVMSDETRKIIENLAHRQEKLTRAHAVSGVSRETSETLAELGVSVEGVAL
jgi:hypothetical protein